MSFFSRPGHALWTGIGLATLILLLWLIESDSDGLGLASFVARFVHIGAAMLWVGMIWFVNFIQLAALGEADEAGRATILRLVVPNVATIFRLTSHLVIASGAVLLLTTGYLFDRWVFPSAVYIPSMRAAMLWGASLAGIVMWGLVHHVVWPGLRIVLDDGASPAAVAEARERVRVAARINLLLAVPVTFAMVAAAHLY